MLREGNVLILPNTTLEVAEACSGIRSLVSLITLGIVLGHFTEPASARRLLIALARDSDRDLANAARVAGTGIASDWIGPGGG